MQKLSYRSVSHSLCVINNMIRMSDTCRNFIRNCHFCLLKPQTGKSQDFLYNFLHRWGKKKQKTRSTLREEGRGAEMRGSHGGFDS